MCVCVWLFFSLSLLSSPSWRKWTWALLSHPSVPLLISAKRQEPRPPWLFLLLSSFWAFPFFSFPPLPKLLYTSVVPARLPWLAAHQCVCVCASRLRLERVSFWPGPCVESAAGDSSLSTQEHVSCWLFSSCFSPHSFESPHPFSPYTGPALLFIFFTISITLLVFSLSSSFKKRNAGGDRWCIPRDCYLNFILWRGELIVRIGGFSLHNKLRRLPPSVHNREPRKKQKTLDYSITQDFWLRGKICFVFLNFDPLPNSRAQKSSGCPDPIPSPFVLSRRCRDPKSSGFLVYLCVWMCVWMC